MAKTKIVKKLPIRKTEINRIIAPKEIKDHKILRKIANKPEFENIDVKMYKYENVDVSVDKINQFVKGVTEKLMKQGLDIKVNTVIKTKLGYKSGRLTSNNQPLQMWTPAWGTDDKNGDELMDWYDNGKGKVKEFYLYVQAEKKRPRAGGKDEHNDCLYECLYSVLKETLIDKWKYAKRLKRALGIERDDMINTDDHMDYIEKNLNVGIFIEGDVNRTPKIKYKNHINLVLLNNHFKVKKTRKEHDPFISFKELPPVFYYRSMDTYYTYNGESLTETAINDFEFKSKDINYLKCESKDKLKATYDEFVYNADKLKEITKGRINLYKTRTIKNTALKLFYDLIQFVDEPDHIDDNEEEFIQGCYRGGLLFHNKYKGKACKGDVCSMYPSIMSKQYMFPIKRGEFQTITQRDLNDMKDKKTGKQIYKSGIYRAKITAPNNAHKKLFHINQYNYFTHIDVGQAHKLGFDIELIEDGKPNFLHYGPDKMLTGSMLFKHYVDYLFKLKQEYPDVVYIKRILNILWGALCERRTSSTHLLKANEPVILSETEQIVSIKIYESEEIKIECEETGERYLTGFARIGPFLTAHGRKMICDLAMEHVDNIDDIQRIYTDCILSSSRLRLKDKEDCELGEFGLEHGMKEVEVINALKVITT